MLPLPAWYGCSITRLLERVDFTGRMKLSRRGLIETATVLWLRGGTAYSFPCFLGSLQPCGARFVAGRGVTGVAAVSGAAGPLRASNDRMVCLCLGRLVIAVSGFLRTGRPVDALSWSVAVTGASG